MRENGGRGARGENPTSEVLVSKHRDLSSILRTLALKHVQYGGGKCQKEDGLARANRRSVRSAVRKMGMTHIKK